ncbi:MAG: hypothetical protein WC647_08540 [Desulfomonilaceae bacterium]
MLNMTRADSLRNQWTIPGSFGSGAIALITGFVVFLAPDTAWALQSHGPPEGLYAHQMAHILLAISMAVLAYWLEINSYTKERGWRLIQLSFLLFLLWNLVAFSGHFVEIRITPDLIEGQRGGWDQRIIIEGDFLTLAYYFLKLDHLVAVPAILCLFLGIRNLYKQTLIKVVRDK